MFPGTMNLPVALRYNLTMYFFSHKCACLNYRYALVDFGLAQKVPGKSAEGLRVGKENTGDNLTNKTKHRPNKDMEVRMFYVDM